MALIPKKAVPLHPKPEQQAMSLNIKRAIKERDLEVQEVARRMGITKVGLSQHINGNPSVEVLERISNAIGCDVADLFDQPPRKPNTIICPYCGKKIVFTKEEG